MATPSWLEPYAEELGLSAPPPPPEDENLPEWMRPYAAELEAEPEAPTRTAPPAASGPVNRDEVLSYLQEKGVPMYQAHGMVANIQGESGFDPTAIGDKGTSGGLFQHHGERFAALQDFAAATGRDWTDWTAQVDYALQEPDTVAYLDKQFGSPEEASYWFTTNWERPANADMRAQERLQYLPSNYYPEISVEGAPKVARAEEESFDQAKADLFAMWGVEEGPQVAEAPEEAGWFKRGVVDPIKRRGGEALGASTAFIGTALEATQTPGLMQIGEYLRKSGEEAKDYFPKPEYSMDWESLKKSWTDEDTSVMASIGDTFTYIAEQAPSSMVDMAWALLNLPSYILMRSQEIGSERAANKGKEEADAVDVMEALPAALASGLFERFGAKGITEAGAKTLAEDALEFGAKQVAARMAKEGGKALGREATTEAMQEGVIEYLGEKLGTEATLDFWEAADRAAAGAVAGGGIGFAGGTTAAGVREVAAGAKQRQKRREALAEEAAAEERMLQAEAEREAAAAQQEEERKAAVTQIERAERRQAEFEQPATPVITRATPKGREALIGLEKSDAEIADINESVRKAGKATKGAEKLASDNRIDLGDLSRSLGRKVEVKDVSSVLRGQEPVPVVSPAPTPAKPAAAKVVSISKKRSRQEQAKAEQEAEEKAQHEKAVAAQKEAEKVEIEGGPMTEEQSVAEFGPETTRAAAGFQLTPPKGEPPVVTEEPKALTLGARREVALSLAERYNISKEVARRIVDRAHQVAKDEGRPQTLEEQKAMEQEEVKLRERQGVLPLGEPLTPAERGKVVASRKDAHKLLTNTLNLIATREAEDEVGKGQRGGRPAAYKNLERLDHIHELATVARAVQKFAGEGSAERALATSALIAYNRMPKGEGERGRIGTTRKHMDSVVGPMRTLAKTMGIEIAATPRSREELKKVGSRNVEMEKLRKAEKDEAAAWLEKYGGEIEPLVESELKAEMEDATLEGEKQLEEATAELYASAEVETRKPSVQMKDVVMEREKSGLTPEQEAALNKKLAGLSGKIQQQREKAERARIEAENQKLEAAYGKRTEEQKKADQAAIDAFLKRVPESASRNRLGYTGQDRQGNIHGLLMDVVLEKMDTGRDQDSWRADVFLKEFLDGIVESEKEHDFKVGEHPYIWLAKFARSVYSRMAAKDPESVPKIVFHEGSKFGPGVAGQYNYGPHTVRINRDEMPYAEGGETTHTLIHELVHALVHDSLDRSNQAAKEMRDLLDHVWGYVDAVWGTDARNHPDGDRISYGLTNVHEFLAEAFSNPWFQKMLAEMPADPKPTRRPVSAWQKFINIVMRALGLKPTQERATVFSEIVRLFPELIQSSEDIMAARAMTNEVLRNGYPPEYLALAPHSKGPVAPYMIEEMREFFDKGVSRERRVTPPRIDQVKEVANAVKRMPWAEKAFDVVTKPLGGMTTSQIVRQYRDRFVKGSLALWERLDQNRQAIANKIQLESQPIQRRWSDLKRSSPEMYRKLGELMTDTTLWSMDPSLPVPVGADAKRWASVVSRWRSLSPEARDIYRDVRDDLAKQRSLQRKALFDKILAFEVDNKPIPPQVLAQMSAANGPAMMKVAMAPLRSQLQSEITKLKRTKNKTPAQKKRLQYLTEEIKAVDGITKAAGRIAKLYDVAGPYFPLRRYGEWVIRGKTKVDGEDWVDFYSTQQEAKEAMARMRYKVDFKGPPARKADLADQNIRMAPSVYSHLLAKFEDQGIRKQVDSAIAQVLADNAMRESELHRRGVQGERLGENMLQGYAERSYAGSWAIADMETAWARANALDEMRKDAGDDTTLQLVVREMKMRENMVLSDRRQHPIERWLAKWGFLGFLGSVSHSLLNLTQTPIFTLPYLGAKYDVASATREMYDAARLVYRVAGEAVSDYYLNPKKWGDAPPDDIWERMKRIVPDADTRRMMDELQERRVLDSTFAQELYQAAHAQRTGFSDSMLNFARTGPQAVEAFNRVVTAIAAYRLSKDRGASHDKAVEDAYDAVDETQLNYAEGNKPRWFKALRNLPGGRAIMMFKMFSQGVTVLLARNALAAGGFALNMVQGKPTTERQKEALKFLAFLELSHTVAAGMSGGFMIPTIAFLLPNVDEEELERAIANLIAEMSDPAVSRLFMKGIFNSMGVDVSSRVDVNPAELWMQKPRADTAEGAGKEMALNAFGPWGSVVFNTLKGYDYLSEGETVKGLKTMAPKLIRDGLSAWETSTRGLTTKAGEVFLGPEELSWWDRVALVQQGVTGFRASKPAEAWEKRIASMRMVQSRQGEATELSRRWVNATSMEERQEIWRDLIVPFNRENPAFRIEFKNLMSTIKDRMLRKATQVHGYYVRPEQRAWLQQEIRY